MEVDEESTDRSDQKEQALVLFKEISDCSKQVSELVQNILNKIENKEYSFDKGISLLDVKNQLLVFYLINLAEVVIFKSTGKSIEGNPLIERLVELRVYLEKIKPIEQKLKYQIDKLIKLAATGTADENDPSRFKANPDAMKSQIESDSDSEGSEDDDNKAKKKPGVYVPPKLSAVHYDNDESVVEKRQTLIERARKHALRSSVMQELKEEYLDTPVEIKSSNSLKQREDQYQKRKREYEEENFTRLPVTKADARRGKRMSVLSGLGDEITRFEDTSILHGDATSALSKKNKKKGPTLKKKRGAKVKGKSVKRRPRK